MIVLPRNDECNHLISMSPAHAANAILWSLCRDKLQMCYDMHTGQNIDLRAFIPQKITATTDQQFILILLIWEIFVLPSEMEMKTKGNAK